jgi:hypothetical protein
MSLPTIPAEKLSQFTAALFDALSLIYATADAAENLAELDRDAGGLTSPSSRAVSLSMMAADKVAEALNSLRGHV